eukprot:m.169229 g.169229  ORF g.169229 m.169229 type:complete len:357 (-) comp16473_c0_seq15:198-1268(-)
MLWSQTRFNLLLSHLPLIITHFYILHSLGGESLAVAQNTYAVSWFKGKELNMVFGLQLCISRLGSTLNMNIMKRIYDSFGETGHRVLGSTLWIGALVCVFSFSSALTAAWMDKRAARILNRHVGKTGDVIRVKDVLSFPVAFWFACLTCVSFYVALYPFIGLAVGFYQKKWRIPQTEAAAINSLVDVISAAASPVFGFLVDKFGRNLQWCMFGVLVTLISHMLLAFTFINPYIPVVIMGTSYSLVACAIWPMAVYLLPESQLGTAFGFMQALQNLGLAVVSMGAGMIVDRTGFLWLEAFFCACLCVSLLSSGLVYCLDVQQGGNLTLSQKQREQRKLEDEEQEPLVERAVDESSTM